MKVEKRIKELLIYGAKCVCGAILVIFISGLFHYREMGWPLFSVILVLSPDGEDAVQVALTRIKTNAIGASIGLLCLLIAPANMWTISLALFSTLCFCYYFKLEDSARTALAAAVIIMLHESGKHYWDNALQRVIAVFSGCMLGLLITYLFHFKSGYRLRDKIRK